MARRSSRGPGEQASGATPAGVLPYAQVIAEMQDAVLVATPDARVIAVNAAAARLFDTPAEELLMPLAEYPARFAVRALEGQSEAPVAQRALGGEVVAPVERRIRTVTGEKTIRTSAAPLRDEKGKIIAAVVLAADISAQKVAEERAKAHAEQLKRARDELARALADAERAAELLEHGDAFLELDAGWRIRRVNAHQEQMSGKRRVETVGRVLWEVWPELTDARRRFRAEYLRCMADRVPVQFEDYFEPLDLWTAITAYPTSSGGIAIFLRDITKRKHAERSLAAAHAFVEAVLDTIVNVVIVLDGEGHIVRLNGACERLTGYSATELIGRRIFEVLIPEEDLRATRETFQKLRAGQFPNQHQNRWRMKDGSERWLEFNNTCITDSQGGVQFVIGTGIDITDRRRQEERLRESEAQFRTLTESMPQIVCALASDGRAEYVNPRWTEYSGLDLASTNDAGWKGILHPDDYTTAAECRRRVIKTLAPQEVELRYRAADGTFRWFLSRLAPVAENGRVIRLIGSAMSIEERRRAEEALRAEHAFTAAVLETVANVVVVLDREGRIVRVNEACKRLTGYAGEELVGRAVLDVLIPDDELAGVREKLRDLRAGQFPNHHENRWRMKDGSERTLEWDNTAILGADGNVEFVIATGVDVTDRRRDEQRLRESEVRLRKSEERLRAEVESTPLALIEWDAEYRVAGYSRRAEELFGWSRDEVFGKRIDEIPWVPEEDWPSVRAVMADMSSGARPSNVNVNRNLRKDGAVIACEWYNSTLRDEAGHLASVLSLVLDVTERTRAAEAARRSEAVLAEAGAMAHLGAWWIDVANAADVNENPLRWSDETYRIFGYEPGEVPISNRLFFMHVHPDDRERVGAAMAHALAARERYALEHRIVRRDGEERILIEQGKGDYDIAGRLVRIVGAVQDVTERRRADEALQRSEQRLRALADSMPQLAWTAQADGFITWYNRRWYEYTGTTPEEMEGWGWQRVHDPAVLPEVVTRWKASIATGDDFEMQFPLRGADGRFRRFLTRVYAMKDERGSVIEWFGTNTDVTVLVEAQEALREADRRKDEFLGMLSHELRNPLAPIRNALYILDRAAPHGEQARRAREIANRQLAHMTRLVDDLLDVTRIARGKIELRRADVDLAALAYRTAEDHRAIMHDRRLGLEVQLPTAPVIVNADDTRMVQVLGNLLHNAAKFTPAGGRITLAIAAERDRAVIRVRDTGPGIASDVLPTIFEPFTQARQTLARSEGGLGLGLALVKGIVATHGGEVHAYSPGQGYGTEFVVTLPLARSRDAPSDRQPKSAPRTDSRRRRVLVIDDNRDAADTIAELVGMLGHDVEVAYDAHDGLAKASEALPDVVFCDIGLPGMDGYEFARRLRAIASKSAVRLVALSGYAQPEDVAKALEAGFDAHVPKPPDPDRLAGLLS